MIAGGGYGLRHSPLKQFGWNDESLQKSGGFGPLVDLDRSK
jgi:hypothetical protein